MQRRNFLKISGAAALSAVLRAGTSNPPNIVFILADDLGYGDLGSYGSQIPTPNIDALAKSGVKFTNFYAASPVCSPSRAALLTGRYAVRTGVPNVLAPGDPTGLNDNETTIAEMLKPAGYATMCVGKWHIGAQPDQLPTSHGFDAYYGMPYSNDQPPVALMSNTQVIESPAQLDTITTRYTQTAQSFISKQASAGTPFFLYLAHTAPHQPFNPGVAFKGKTGMGPYADTVAELDWSVGQVMQSLKDAGVDQNTLVFFSSDNGPWFQGSPGRLRGRKGDTFEGGMREPMIATFPGTIPAGNTVTGVATTMDILPTLARLVGVPLPANRLDGTDITPMLTGQANQVVRDAFFYFSGLDLQCARVLQWKLHVARYNTPAYTPVPQTGYYNLRLTNPELYNLDKDPEEANDVSGDHPEMVQYLQQLIANAMPNFPLEVQLAWDATQRRPVYPSSSGAWPVPLMPPITP